MRLTKLMPIALTALLLGLQGAAAQETGRYQMERNGDDFVRLDTQTGEMSLCREKEGTLTCRMGADERSAFEDELQRLEKRIAALEATTASGISKAPTDEEIDRSIGIMERFMRSFFGMVQEFEGKQSSEEPVPNRS
ncbi:hypothetical protein [Rhizobium sp. RU36D]|uniref:hypothetical protein n=1 Tax=Rhizobium sp. RU36D TaxID=1907415 RepID=UPI0009D894AF|nr:hypothetical protein [Rhizobium sp. RU36D]SMD18912.1 hypothetical protein SAMN05880593_13731 [Rhizobium sp. RU36D]